MDITTAPTEAELNQLLKDTFTTDLRPGYLVVNGCVLPQRYSVMKKDIKEFEVFDTDIWICGFPKTGTTWISEITWLIAHDLDYEGAKVVDYKRTRMLEFSMLFDVTKEVLFGGERYELDSIGHAKEQKNPRTIKSHFPFSLLPDQITNGTRSPKIIWTARNPMDTCISYYHHCKNYEGFTGTLEQFCQLFIFDKINYGPYPAHVLSFWEQRKKSNILFVTYEEMQKDLVSVIEKVAQFLNKSLSKEDIKGIQDYVSFDSMKKNPAVNKENVMKDYEASIQTSLSPFIRSGKMGGYKSVLSPKIIAQFRYWMAKKFEGSGLNLLDE